MAGKPAKRRSAQLKSLSPRRLPKAKPSLPLVILSLAPALRGILGQENSRSMLDEQFWLPTNMNS